MSNKEVRQNEPKWFSKLQEAFNDWRKESIMPKAPTTVSKNPPRAQRKNIHQEVHFSSPAAAKEYQKKMELLSQKLTESDKAARHPSPKNALFVSQILQISISGKASKDHEPSPPKPKKRH